jgi:hypothetical protein
MSRPSSSAHVLRMVHRPMRLLDLPEALSLLPAQVSTDPTERTAIAAQWPALLQQQPALQSGVMEDLARAPGQRILGWGVSLLLSPAQARALQLDGEPPSFVARRVYAELRTGRLRLMDDRELGRCNAAGEVVGLVLHFTLPRIDLADPQVHKIVACAQESFRMHHTGFNWRAIYLENSASFMDVHRESGFLPRRFADERELSGLPESERPVFMGLTREEARLRLPGTTLRNCFESEPPRFRFSALQRRLLWLALFDDADTALMPELGISVHGLKKLWRGIYERVDLVEPGFFGDDGGDDEGKRGPEKRRQVLAYVRQRLEELRPWQQA